MNEKWKNRPLNQEKYLQNDKESGKRKETETRNKRTCNCLVIIFVIFCYFPLDETENKVYNTATNESTQCQPQAAGTFQPLVGTGK